MNLKPSIIFEDKDYLVVNKPAGMTVNIATSTKGQYTLQDWIGEYLGSSALSWSLRMGLVHRLDKETSGLMVLAKSETAYLSLLTEFKERRVQKHYLALVHNLLKPREGNINLPIKRSQRNRIKFIVDIRGKKASTFYKVLNYYLNPKQKIKSKKFFTLVELDLKTGRTHQIRVHLSHLMNPIVSDPIYAGKKTRQSDRGWCPHLFLQSIYLSFNDYKQNLKTFSLPLDPQLKNALCAKLIIHQLT